MPELFDPQPWQLWLQSWGVWAWPVFLGLQAAQVLVFWIPGEVVQIAGGMVFGVWTGTFLSLAGLTVGNLLAFRLARFWGKDRVERWLARQGYTKLQTLIHHPRLEVLLGVLFLIPFLPKDIFAYLAGFSDLKTFRFLGITTAARIPSLLLSSWVGDLAFHGAGAGFFVVLVVSSLVGAAAFLCRKSLLALLVR